MVEGVEGFRGFGIWGLGFRDPQTGDTGGRIARPILRGRAVALDRGTHLQLGGIQ